MFLFFSETLSIVNKFAVLNKLFVFIFDIFLNKTLEFV